VSVSFTYQSNIDAFFAKIVERAQSKIRVAIDDAVEELFRNIKTDLEKIYKKAVVGFYAGYSPAYYHRNRSLYKLLEISDSPDEVTWEFIPGNATAMRGGGTVYELAFLGGWHGGAAGTDHNGESVGSPHYRAPYGYYTHWSLGGAAQSTPPFETWESEVETYKGTLRDKFEALLQKHISMIQWF